MCLQIDDMEMLWEADALSKALMGGPDLNIMNFKQVMD